MHSTIQGRIENIQYTPFMCNQLEEIEISSFSEAMCHKSSFILKVDNMNKAAISWWVSAKRTRSYPFARVYNTLAFSGKRITIIPVFKDEGLEGDRDYIQFDTVALMSLLNIHVIIAYYTSAEKSLSYTNKITKQRFDNEFLLRKINEIVSLQQSDALHWNMSELDNVGAIGNRAIISYRAIASGLDVAMSDFTLAQKRMSDISGGRTDFLTLSRTNAEQAQIREAHTNQPNEHVDGTKSKLTITNYLGGMYHLTVDETRIDQSGVYLVEAKHCKQNNKFITKENIKDGLLKMILYSNLTNVICDNSLMRPIACLKLTNGNNNFNNLTIKEQVTLHNLRIEASRNNITLILGNDHD